MSEDVRMKGFGRRTSVADALAWIDARVEPLGVERVSFRGAHGRVLAEDLVAGHDVPPHPRSAMDGYAVRAADLPGPLNVVGSIIAAESYDRRLEPREALRVMTGARVPEGADQVVMVEDSSLQGSQVSLRARPQPGANVLRTGEDLAQGEVVLPRGRCLGPEDVAMMLCLGVLEISVQRRPRVRLIPTGTELVRPGMQPVGSQLIESNSFMLEALALRDGAEPILHPIVPDDLAMLRRALSSDGADLVVVTGGTSVGKEDYPPLILRELGELPIHGLDMKPASPSGLGTIGGHMVVLAPGYPVAAWVAWDLLIRPIVQRMAGREVALPYRTVSAAAGKALRKPESRVEVVRVLLEHGEAHPLPGGAAILSSITKAHGFVLLPAGSEGVAAGEPVTVHLYR